MDGHTDRPLCLGNHLPPEHGVADFDNGSGWGANMLCHR